jgi:uncharacterized glyoxalase superfamily protein PhnB
MLNSSPSVVPMLSYENGLAALDWLCSVFGLNEQTRMVGSDGQLAGARRGTRGRWPNHACFAHS